MSREHNPQAEQMGDESMVRNLAHQADAIWPQEAGLFGRYDLSGPLLILDLGCGTGEISRRLAERYPEATVLGVDILESNLAFARRDSARLGSRVRFEQGDAYALAAATGTFDLVVCRHLSQAVPDFGKVLFEITRVLRPGGWLHLLTEDYGMLHMPADGHDPDRFWLEHAIGYLQRIGCDGRIGRNSPALLAAAGYEAVAMDYVTVDTLRVPRPTFAGILEAWRDGYAPALAESSGAALAEIRRHFDLMIAAVRTPPQYAVWHVPVCSGRTPNAAR